MLASSLFTLSYVGGLYLSTSTRVGSATARDELGRALDKDHPRVVRNRLKVVGWSTVASCAGVGILLGRKGAFNGQVSEHQPSTFLLGRSLAVESAEYSDRDVHAKTKKDGCKVDGGREECAD